MAKILIPHKEKKRALVVVDMQDGFLTSPNRAKLVEAIVSVIRDGGYELFVETVFHADKGSLWDKQTDWTFPAEPTIPEILNVLDPQKTVHVSKSAKSIFDGDVDVFGLLKKKGIEEVHIVGVDTNDCVLASAFESFDGGFFTYVLEECTDSSMGPAMRKAAIAILRNADLTNHSALI